MSGAGAHMFECHKKDKAVNDGRHSEALSVLTVSVELVSNKKNANNRFFASGTNE